MGCTSTFMHRMLEDCEPQEQRNVLTVNLLGHFEHRQQNGHVHEKPLLYFERSFLRILKY